MFEPVRFINPLYNQLYDQICDQHHGRLHIQIEERPYIQLCRQIRDQLMEDNHV